MKSQAMLLARRYPGGALGLFLVLVIFTVAFLGTIVWHVPHDAQNLAQALQGPSSSHPFGTDQFGRDLLSRVMYGGRLSVGIGLASVAIGLVFGVAMGVAAGVYRSFVEAVFMRLIDALLALPGMVQAVIFVAVIGRGVTPLIIALGIYSIPIFARVAYSSTRQVMEQDYIQAVRALGASTFRLAARHVLPNIMSSILTVATLRIGANVLTGAALNFFGLGVQPPDAEWGLMIAEGRSHSWSDPYLIVFPGMSLFLLCLGFNLLGDALRDWLDPHARSEGAGRAVM